MPFYSNQAAEKQVSPPTNKAYTVKRFVLATPLSDAGNFYFYWSHYNGGCCVTQEELDEINSPSIEHLGKQYLFKMEAQHVDPRECRGQSLNLNMSEGDGENMLYEIAFKMSYY